MQQNTLKILWRNTEKDRNPESATTQSDSLPLESSSEPTGQFTGPFGSLLTCSIDWLCVLGEGEPMTTTTFYHDFPLKFWSYLYKVKTDQLLSSLFLCKTYCTYRGSERKGGGRSPLSRTQLFGGGPGDSPSE